MTAQHDMTETDLRNFLAMNRAKKTRPADKIGPNLVALYGAIGLLGMGFFLEVTLTQFSVMALFTLGFAWLFTFTIKRAAKRQVGRSIRSVGGLRIYTIGDGVLETQTNESRILTRLDRITELRSNARGTLVCLGEVHPLYLPFGNDYRPDFIAALRAALPKGVGDPPPLTR